MQHNRLSVLQGLRRAWRSVLLRLRGGFPRREPPPGLQLPSSAALAAPRLSLARPLALALQGGGAHGAFTWGVLDRLLEDPGCRIAAISGSSAGALNAAVLASGYLEGGPARARERLAALWEKLAGLARFSPLQPTPLEALLLGRTSEWTFSHLAFDLAARVLSPTQLNPLGLNPLRDILDGLVDFAALREPAAIRLIIAATDVETGEARLFANRDLSPDVLLASACLPMLSPAVEIDGAHYWDGGFASNPPILALLEACDVDDIVLVRLSPSRHNGVPTTARGIQARLSRIVFDAPLKRELEALSWLRRMAEGKALADDALARRLASVTLHTIGDDDVLGKLGNASRLSPDWRLVRSLKDAGRAAAERRLAARAAANDAGDGRSRIAI